MRTSNLTYPARCQRCVLEIDTSYVVSNKDGICSVCIQSDEIRHDFGTGLELGISKFEHLVQKMKKHGRNRKYDCILGVSGGTDSSFLVHLLTREFDLRVLAVHYDNTWNSAIATTNIALLLRSGKIDLHTHVVNNHEADDIFRAFFFAGVAEIEASTDLGYAYVLRKVAKKYGIKFLIEGHSFIEEGITPLSNNYFDGRYIQGVHQQYGSIPLRTYPLMTFPRFVSALIFHPVVFVRPLWYLNYSKSAAQEMLSQTYGWQYYGGHHLENRMTAFYHTIYLPQKFCVDMRINSIAAQVRNGLINRDLGIQKLTESPAGEKGLVNYFCKRLKISSEDFNRIMLEVPKSWKQYPNDKAKFELWEPFFRIMAKHERVPMSFYLKYCKGKI